MDTWIGQQLGPYELQSRLGAGGMGVVYRAVHRRLGQARAIKVLPTMLAHDETFVQRFEREARLASELRHPNIVMIFDIAEQAGTHYIVMELLDGRSLHEVIRQDGPLPLERTIHLLGQLADALDFAHARGVVHRDVKPGNALVDAADHLTLVDFGIARAAEGTRLTEASTRIGTAEYMAPESIAEGDSSAGTDLYALGVIAYEMLTGRVPFTGLNSQTIMYAQIHTPPPPPRALRADLAPAIEAVVLRQLDKDRTRRFPTGRAFVRALAEAHTTASGGRAPAITAWLDSPPVADRPAANGPAPTIAAAGAGSSPSTGRPRAGPGGGPKTPPHPLGPASGRTPVPPPPSVSGAAAAPPAPSGLQRVIEESRLGMPTIYKLTIGMAVLVLLLMSFLPTPRNPMQASASARLAFPLGAAGGYLLGGDELGRDVLSRLMSGGRFLAIRLLIVGAILAGLTLLVRRRLARRAAKRGAGGTAARRLWAVTPTLVMIVTFGVALSVVSEAAIGLFGRPDTLEYLGPVGNVLLGTPREPPAPSWGGMLVQARPLATQAPWLLVFPAAGLLLVAAGLVLFGSGVVDVLRQRARRSG